MIEVGLQLAHRGGALQATVQPPVRVQKAARFTGLGSAIHCADHIPPTAKKNRPSKPCAHCSGKPKRKETTYLCIACQVPLCVDCFAGYHYPNSKYNKIAAQS